MPAYLLNLADLFFTLYTLRHGGVELNPLLQSVPHMVGYKVIGVGALCWWLSKQDKPLARWGLRGCTAVYGALCVYHLVHLVFI